MLPTSCHCKGKRQLLKYAQESQGRGLCPPATKEDKTSPQSKATWWWGTMTPNPKCGDWILFPELDKTSRQQPLSFKSHQEHWQTIVKSQVWLQPTPAALRKAKKTKPWHPYQQGQGEKEGDSFLAPCTAIWELHTLSGEPEFPFVILSPPQACHSS